MEALILSVVFVVCLALVVRSLAKKVSLKNGGGCSDCAQGSSCRGKK